MQKELINKIFTLNAQDLNQIIEAVKLRRNQLHSLDAHSLRIGDRVSFEGKYGRTEMGTVEKIKIKYVLVRTDRGQRWNVPGSHLTPIKQKEAVNA